MTNKLYYWLTSVCCKSRDVTDPSNIQQQTNSSCLHKTPPEDHLIQIGYEWSPLSPHSHVCTSEVPHGRHSEEGVFVKVSYRTETTSFQQML